jgi:hypothetical protein
MAPETLPVFVPAADGSDWFLTFTAFILLLILIGAGTLFLRLHTLPERMAHRSQKLQFEIVAVLGLLALFTHQHIFWVAGLLLALVDLPDISSPMKRMADSLDRLAEVSRGSRTGPSSDDGRGEG